MTGNEFTELFNLVLAGWPAQRQRLTNADIEAMTWMYGQGLKDLDHALVKRALTRIARTSRFIPTIAEIREAAGIITHGNLRTGVEAWGPVHRAIGTYGSHRTPGVDFRFEDPITTRVVSALGWLDLCASEHDAMPHFRARFIDAYEQIAKDERVNQQASTGMIGIASAPELSPAEQEAMLENHRKQQLTLAPPAERSAMLREVLDEARTNTHRPLGDFVATLLPVQQFYQGPKREHLEDMGDYGDDTQHSTPDPEDVH